MFIQKLDTCTSSCLNPLWQGPSCFVFFSSQQGLWVCHGSNIIASITRRGDCWSWCLVNRSLQLSRCFTVIITTYQPLIATDKHLCTCNTLTSTVSVASLYPQTACSTVTSHAPLSNFVSFPAGHYAADAEILHPPEDRVHRQTLLLWRGNEREVSANKSEKLWDEATRKPCGINRFGRRGEQVAYKDTAWGLNGL